mmetsp:Transcript_50694/g.135096  ORF Transcript_50694/g.135096 Transcript_50694/m.135096 type:complete len:253 (+) Transcript_50694:2010-2768(+)
MAPPDVERTEVGLALRELRSRVVPRVTTSLCMAIEQHDVLVLVYHVLHAHLDAIETRANDGHRMRPRVSRMLKVLQPLQHNPLIYSLAAEKLPASRIVGLDCALLAGEHVGHHLQQLAHLGVRLHWHLEGFTRFELQRGHFKAAPGLAKVVEGNILSLQHQHVALKLMVENVPRVVGKKHVLGPSLLVHCAEVLVVEGLDHRVRVRNKSVLTMLRKQREVRCASVHHHHRRGHQTESHQRSPGNNCQQLATH